MSKSCLEGIAGWESNLEILGYLGWKHSLPDFQYLRLMVRLVQIRTVPFPVWTCLLGGCLMALECGELLEIPGNCKGRLWKCYLCLVSQISECWPSFPACDVYCSYERNFLKLLQRTSTGTTCHLQHLLQAGEDRSSGVEEEGVLRWFAG